MSSPVTVYAIGHASENFTVDAPSDPTGSDVEFAVTQGDTAQPSTWVAGSWGTWSSTTGEVSVVSPTMGDDGSEALTVSIGSYYLWARWTVGSELVTARMRLVSI